MSTTRRGDPNPTLMSSRHPCGMTLTMATVHEPLTLVNTQTASPQITSLKRTTYEDLEAMYAQARGLALAGARSRGEHA